METKIKSMFLGGVAGLISLLILVAPFGFAALCDYLFELKGDSMTISIIIIASYFFEAGAYKAMSK